MIYGFVRQSGGQVRVDSELSKETTLMLYFPRLVGALSATYVKKCQELTFLLICHLTIKRLNSPGAAPCGTVYSHRRPPSFFLVKRRRFRFRKLINAPPGSGPDLLMSRNLAAYCVIGSSMTGVNAAASRKKLELLSINSA